MDYTHYLKATLQASGWSQERLAAELRVSFPTLNSWINGRSQPRKAALEKIESLYLNIVGVETVNTRALSAAKAAAIKLTAHAKDIVSNKDILAKLTLYLTYHTNTIEGSTMTLADVEQVIFEHRVLSNRTAIEQAEARSHQAALNWLLDELVGQNKNFVIDEPLILGLHLRLMNGILSDAGKYRQHSVRIMGANVALTSWQKVPDTIIQFVASINQASDDIVSDLARAHANFEQIHPFSDGNGRCGRLLLLAQALHAGLMPPLVTKERKHAYYKYLQAAQSSNNYRPLELFMAESMQRCGELIYSQ